MAIAGIGGVWAVVSLTSTVREGWVALTFLPIFAITLASILLEARARPFSLHLMHLLALFVFMELTPLLQFVGDTFPQYNMIQIEPEDVLVANIILMLWLGMYFLGYRFGKLMAERLYLARITRLLCQPLDPLRIKFGGVIALIALAYLAYRGLGGAFTRKGYGEIVDPSNSVDFILTTVFVRSIPLLALGGLLLLVFDIQKERRFGTILLLLGCAGGIFWFDNPFAAARYWTASMLMGFAAIVFLRHRKTARLFIAAMVVGVIILPVLNVGRSNTEFFSDLTDVAMMIDPIEYLSESGDFQIYSILILFKSYINDYGIAWGRQLLGVFLFWIPRQFWEGKPIGSAAYVTESLGGFDNTNLAAPLQAEAIINFGWVGVPLFAGAFGMALGYLDSVYHSRSADCVRDKPRVIDMIYLFWLGMVFFITRGDLMSSFAYTAGITIAGLLVTMAWLRPLPNRHAAGF
jgi:oligosaccharide repeat unit polymerase